MTLRTSVLLSSAILGLGAIAATSAIAARGKATATTTIKAVTKPPGFLKNRYIQDNLRWDKDVYTVPSGGTLHIVNLAAEEGPHTFTIVLPKDEPKTGLQAAKCKICEVLGKAHGANPNSNAPPKFQFLEDGVGQNTPPNIDKPGDSGVTGKGKKGEFINVTVTAPAGTKLVFMCLIHPWMQAELDVT